jgi:hypothetical protein
MQPTDQCIVRQRQAGANTSKQQAWVGYLYISKQLGVRIISKLEDSEGQTVARMADIGGHFPVDRM